MTVRVLPGDGAGVEADHQHPDGDGHCCCGADLPPRSVLQRVNHGQVAANSDAAQEGLAGVEVIEEKVYGQHTNIVSVDPNASPKEVQPQAEATSEGQVTQSQAEQIHPELVLLPDVLPGNVEEEGVGRDGGDDDSHVEKQKGPPSGCDVNQITFGVIGGHG